MAQLARHRVCIHDPDSLNSEPLNHNVLRLYILNSDPVSGAVDSCKTFHRAPRAHRNGVGNGDF